VSSRMLCVALATKPHATTTTPLLPYQYGRCLRCPAGGVGDGRWGRGVSESEGWGAGSWIAASWLVGAGAALGFRFRFLDIAAVTTGVLRLQAPLGPAVPLPGRASGRV
jgi:hypothetical protein